jgi:hypothetical protein
MSQQLITLPKLHLGVYWWTIGICCIGVRFGNGGLGLKMLVKNAQQFERGLTYIE